VITPLQYLNALEYRLSIESSKHVTHNLHIITDHSKRLALLSNIIDENDWDIVVFEFRSDISRKKIISYTKELIDRKKNLRNIKCSLNSQDQIILGSLTNTFCKYLHKCEAKSVFLDDGLATLLMKEKLKSPYFFPNKMNRFLETLIYNQFYFIHHSFKLFSIFSVNHKKITLQKNQLEHLKSRNSVNNKNILNEVIFIGQPLIELNIVPKERFIKHVEEVKNYYENKGLKFSYLLHPGENENLKKESWNVISLNEPIEVFYMRSKSLPKVFCSFYSSANINLGIIFNEITEQHFWKLDSAWLFTKYKIDFYKELQLQDFDFYSIKKLTDELN
jgi:hypothetical protein